MRNVFFGLGTRFGDGNNPSIAINSTGLVLEVHSSENFWTLWHRVGAVNGASIVWGDAVNYDKGVKPMVAMDGSVAIEVHKSQYNSGLWYHLGRVAGYELTWGASTNYGQGSDPSVAIRGGVVVAVHQSYNPNGLSCRLGAVNNGAVNWAGEAAAFSDNGQTPKVAVNGNGDVVCVYAVGTDLWCQLGEIQQDMILWHNAARCGTGAQPAITLSDTGDVILVYSSGRSLYRRMGHIHGLGINWVDEPTHYEDGVKPSVACAGNMAVHAHESAYLDGLWASNALIMDRARWMTDRLGVLGNRTLRQLVLPAAHDAGMYTRGPVTTLGKTQNLNIQQQLEYGIRYFDLRPKWVASDASFLIVHNFIPGPPLADVLNQVAAFMQAGARELVILKFSHFSNFTSGAVYDRMVAQITDVLGPCMVTRPDLNGARVAEIPLDQLVQNGGRVLVVCDGPDPVNRPNQGVLVYRDWEADNAHQGDLRVFDIYSNTTDFDRMKTNQFAKFAAYTGICKNQDNNQDVPCDMFLLSWTLTPYTGVWSASAPANRKLGASMREMGAPNSSGRIANLLYVDYVEYSRVTDVAIFQNGLRG